jgi:hypothetical protein
MSNVTPRIVTAEYTGGYRIKISFDDGVAGEIDLESVLWGEVFEPLKDKALFAQFKLYPERSTIYWPNNADLAPAALYDRVRRSAVKGPKNPYAAE